jgi:hypothetical protein
MGYDFVKSMMFGHAWGMISAPGLDLSKPEVQTALGRYVWAAAAPICASDLSIKVVEITDKGVKAIPDLEQVAEDACVPDYIFKAFPAGFYGALLDKYPLKG